MGSKLTYQIDGKQCSSYEELVVEFSTKIFGNYKAWSGDLDQLNDMLRGGYGTPSSDEPFTIIWQNADISKKCLDHKALHEKLLEWKDDVHPSNKNSWLRRIDLAGHGRGQTLFEQVVDVITKHANITLILH
jgi:hypothetical protein